MTTIAPVSAETQQDKQITDNYIMENGDVKTVYKDGSYYIILMLKYNL
jgi:hypothetical protein